MPDLPSVAAIARAVGLGERVFRTVGALGEIDSDDLPGLQVLPIDGPTISAPPRGWGALGSKLKNAGSAFLFRQSGGRFARQGPMASVGRTRPSEVYSRYSSRRGRSSTYGASLGAGTLGGTSLHHASSFLQTFPVCRPYCLPFVCCAYTCACCYEDRGAAASESDCSIPFAS